MVDVSDKSYVLSLSEHVIDNKRNVATCLECVGDALLMLWLFVGDVLSVWRISVGDIFARCS